MDQSGNGPPVEGREEPPSPAAGPTRSSLREVCLLALRLGLTAFGGPAVHIALLRRETVERRRWVTDRQYLDLLSVTNLIPGPNSTEIILHIGRLRAGWTGLLLAGAAFVLPSTAIVLLLAALYVRYETALGTDWALYLVRPVAVAVVAQAVLALARAALTGATPLLLVAVVSLAYLAGIHELVLLFGVGLLYAWVRVGTPLRLPPPLAVAFPALVIAGPAAAAPGLVSLFLTFLKIGATLYGSGYVLLAFLERDFVTRTGWLTGPQLLDLVALGQVTPGPLLTTATAVGYFVGGWMGGLTATAGIFLPAFVFVAVVSPLASRLRAGAWTSGVLDGLNTAALGLMAAVTLELAAEAVVDPLTSAVALAAVAAMWQWRVNPAWLLVSVALAGLLLGQALA